MTWHAQQKAHWLLQNKSRKTIERYLELHHDPLLAAFIVFPEARLEPTDWEKKHKPWRKHLQYSLFTGGPPLPSPLMGLDSPPSGERDEGVL